MNSTSRLLGDLRSRMIQPPASRRPIGKEAAVIRSQLSDFQVEELPLVEPTGSGEHLWLTVEKRGVTHAEMIMRLARALEISPREIGSAGRKDRHAITRQIVSVPATCKHRTALADSDEVAVLSQTLHGRKLRTGQLRGNRFQITMRWKNRSSDKPDPGFHAIEDCGVVGQALDQLAVQGMPNYFGPQRFGHGGSTVVDGLALLTGQISQRDILRNNSERHLRFALSAVQSAIFNLLLADRVDAGSLNRILAGDVVRVANSERWFAENTARITDEERRMLTIGGPMFGRKMPKAQLAVGDQESAALQRVGLKPGDFDRFKRLTVGTRRPLVVRPDHVSAETASPADGEASAIRIRFDLPAGSYATVLLREFLPDIEDAAAPDRDVESPASNGSDATRGPDDEADI